MQGWSQALLSAEHPKAPRRGIRLGFISQSRCLAGSQWERPAEIYKRANPPVQGVNITGQGSWAEVTRSMFSAAQWPDDWERHQRVLAIVFCGRARGRKWHWQTADLFGLSEFHTHKQIVIKINYIAVVTIFKQIKICWGSFFYGLVTLPNKFIFQPIFSDLALVFPQHS